MSIECAFFGSLTRDAERRTSKNGNAYTILNILVGKDDATQFVSTFVFGDAANNVGDLVKGDRVYCEGSIEINSWTAQDGTTRSGFKVLSFKCDQTHRIGRNKPKREQGAAAPLREEIDDEIPY